MSYFQRLTIVCPPIIKATWGATPIADLFVGDNLELRIQPDNYTRVADDSGGSAFNDFYNGVGYDVKPQRIGFNIAIQEKRDELALAIAQLSKLSLGDNYTNFKPVTIHDQIRIEDHADYVRGYAIRRGKLWIENLTGTVQQGQILCATPIIETPQAGRLNNGFNLRFLSTYKDVIS